MTLGQKQEIFTENLSKLIVHAIQSGYKVRLREVERTAYQQAEYLRTGRTKTLNSMHLKSLAADLYFTRFSSLVLSKPELQHLGDFWEQLHPSNRWGGNWSNFTDCPHFEMIS